MMKYLVVDVDEDAVVYDSCETFEQASVAAIKLVNELIQEGHSTKDIQAGIYQLVAGSEITPKVVIKGAQR